MIFPPRNDKAGTSISRDLATVRDYHGWLQIEARPAAPGARRQNPQLVRTSSVKPSVPNSLASERSNRRSQRSCAR